jgi:hypothetical protein
MVDVLDAIGNVIDKKGSDLVHSFRDNGKWRSITVQVPVVSSDQLYEVSASLNDMFLVAATTDVSLKKTLRPTRVFLSACFSSFLSKDRTHYLEVLVCLLSRRFLARFE